MTAITLSRAELKILITVIDIAAGEGWGNDAVDALRARLVAATEGDADDQRQATT